MKSLASGSRSICLAFSFLPLLTGVAGPQIMSVREGHSVSKRIEVTENAWQFPPYNGESAVAFPTIVSSLKSGLGTLSLVTTYTGKISSSSTPRIPLIVASFSIMPSESITLAHFPRWEIYLAPIVPLSEPYTMQVFDEGPVFTRSSSAYSGATVNDHLCFPAYGGPVTLQEGHIYLFEVVQNARTR